MPNYTGTIVKVSAPPRAVKIQPPGDPPPDPLNFTPVSDDDAWLILASAKTGDTVTVTATAPGQPVTAASKP
jgi:hypothetical protein